MHLDNKLRYTSLHCQFLQLIPPQWAGFIPSVLLLDRFSHNLAELCSLHSQQRGTNVQLFLGS